MEIKNILLVHNYYQIPGGEDSVLENEKKMLQEKGNKIVLYTRSNSELKTMSKISKVLLPLSTIFNFRTYIEVKKIIKQEQIDIVHVHNTLNLISPSIYYAAISCGVPVIQTVHNFRLLCPGATFYRDGHICEDCVSNGLHCAIKYSCYRKSKIQTMACVINTKIHRITGIYGKINYICLTEFNKNKLLKLKQVKEDNIFIKPNFVESNNIFIPKEKRNNQFIFVGRLDELKGIVILFEAWKLMGKTAPKLIVCGVGPMEKWCKEFIKTNDINIDLKGFVPNNEARKFIANSKALILPTQWFEGFPMSIVESYSVGTPVIASDIGNTGCIVIEGVTGYKFKSDSKSSLVSAINRLNENENIYDTTINEYRNRYTKETNYSILSRIYQKIG